MASNELKPPQATKGDVVHAFTKAGLSGIPVIGGPASELFQYLVQTPLDRRRAKWMAAVGEKLVELESRGLDIRKLSQEDDFITAVMHASHIALRTHQDEKLEALRNAVFNVAAGQSPGEALEQMFFEWIGSLSVLHLQILKLFQNPTPNPDMGMGGLRDVLEYNMPKLKGHQEVYDQVWKDLFSRGLVTTETMNVTVSALGLRDKRTTGIGDKFLRFVSEPTL